MTVICHAPWLLVSANLLEGRTLTSFHTIHDDIENAGGTWLDQAIVNDGQLGDESLAGRHSAVQRQMVKLFAPCGNRQAVAT
jgi:protease I